MSMRPKKERFINGVKLVDNLYPDPRGREGYYSYRRPDTNKRKTFQRATVEEANAFAEECNSVIEKGFLPAIAAPQRETLAYHVPTYILYQERINPKLIGKEAWRNQCYAMHQLARHFERVGQITMDELRIWWDTLTYNQQKLRMASFRRLFNWLMADGLVPKLKYNPFTTADDLPRLLSKSKPAKARLPCTQTMYNTITAKAPELDYECLVIGMGISLYTTARIGDICKLKFDKNIVDGKLQMVVGKSEAQKGTARATRLSWTLSDHPQLKTLIDRARELSLINRRCPFIISHTPKRRAWNGEKEHLYQVTANRMSKMFKEVMESCCIEGTSFHEVRGLSATLYSSEGYENKDIQWLMSHEELSTTQAYQNADALPYEEVTMRLGDVL